MVDQLGLLVFESKFVRHDFPNLLLVQAGDIAVGECPEDLVGRDYLALVVAQPLDAGTHSGHLLHANVFFGLHFIDESLIVHELPAHSAD